MADAKDVLTTGEVARICRVTIRTVIKWYESGRLPGYKLPGSRDRRFQRQAVEDFLRRHAMPLDLLEPGAAPRGPLVLVVDDDAGVRTMTLRLLRTLGTLEVDEAASGWEAGLKTAAREPRLLLLDYRLQDTTGAQVLATLRGMPELRQPAIVIMSAHLSDEQAEALLAAGADGWLPKPFTLEQLRATVLKHVGPLR